LLSAFPENGHFGSGRNKGDGDLSRLVVFLEGALSDFFEWEKAEAFEKPILLVDPGFQ
jgi:hypothetical protein